ncbi:MAG: metallophosphoesterase [Pseudomonadota bacterium]
MDVQADETPGVAPTGVLTSSAAGQRSVRIIHLSDPHLPTPGPISWATLLNKRIFGHLNWQFRRRFVHRREVLDCLTNDINQRRYDQLLIGGDLINIALPQEFVSARRWMDGLGDPSKIMVVPGNHDTYVRVPWDKGLGQWADYMTGLRVAATAPDGPLTLEERKPTGFSDFPFIRRVGPVQMVGLNTAPSTAPGLATGRAGPEQRARLKSMLAHQTTPSKGDSSGPNLTVILGHHPWSGAGMARHKRMTDGRDLIDVVDATRVAGTGQIMMLHGHAHVPMHQAVGAHQTLHVGVASASYAHQREEQHDADTGSPPAGQYHCFDISTPASKGQREGTKTVQITLTVRAVDPRDMTVYTAYQGTPEAWSP